MRDIIHYRFLFHTLIGYRQRQFNNEDRSCTLLALHLNRSTKQSDKTFGDRQTKTVAIGIILICSTLEWYIYAFHHIFGDADSRIAYLHCQPAILIRSLETYISLGCEFDSIGDEIVDDTLYLVLITLYRDICICVAMLELQSLLLYQV